jgi:hypothetical protein
MFIDPLGLYDVDFVDYIRAQGGTVDEYEKNGEAYARVSCGDTTKNYRLNSGRMDDEKINSIFGFESFLKPFERETGVGIGIRNNTLYRDIITPGKNYYHLDYDGSIIRLGMDEYTMAVNMEIGDAGILSEEYSFSLELADWLKKLYYEQYQKEYELEAYAIAVELGAHAGTWNSMSKVPYAGEHARIANIGVKGHELPWERWFWDQYNPHGAFNTGHYLPKR